MSAVTLTKPALLMGENVGLDHGKALEIKAGVRARNEGNSFSATPPLIIGFDAEWTVVSGDTYDLLRTKFRAWMPDGTADFAVPEKPSEHAHNQILCYTIHCRAPNGATWSGITLPSEAAV